MFLENYVMKHVDQERLERWLIRKTTQEKRKAIQPLKTATSSGMEIGPKESFKDKVSPHVVTTI